MSKHLNSSINILSKCLWIRSLKCFHSLCSESTQYAISNADICFQICSEFSNIQAAQQMMGTELIIRCLITERKGAEFDTDKEGLPAELVFYSARAVDFG